MTIKINRERVKVKAKHPRLDKEEFTQLYDLLFYAMLENETKMARLLGISKKTARNWFSKPPKNGWWTYILREAIKALLSQSRKYGQSLEHRNYVSKLLHQIPEGKRLALHIDHLAYDYAASEVHLKTLLLDGPMDRATIMLPRYSGGYSRRQLELAARALGVVKQQSGFGKDKISQWRLPTEEDLYPEIEPDEIPTRKDQRQP